MNSKSNAFAIIRNFLNLYRKRNNSTEDSLYIKILIWAYKKSSTGFTRAEFDTEFDLQRNPDLHRWVDRIFYFGTNDNPPIIAHFRNGHNANGEVGYWCLTDKGMSSAIDYLELKEAQESGRRATIIAVISIAIGILVGTAQIVVQICFNN